MGRIKEIYIELLERYGGIPKDFNLGEYYVKTRKVNNIELKKPKDNDDKKKEPK